MDQREAFLASIIENPDDDAPRLIFADWLDENGEAERAEFVRIQIELAKYGVGRCPNSRQRSSPNTLAGYPVVFGKESECGRCRWCELRRREEWLLSKNRYFWLPIVLMDLEAQSASDICVYRRGFVAEITLKCTEWLEHRERLLKAAPLERVTLSDWRQWQGYNDWVEFLHQAIDEKWHPMPRFNGMMILCRTLEQTREVGQEVYFELPPRSIHV